MDTDIPDYLDQFPPFRQVRGRGFCPDLEIGEQKASTSALRSGSGAGRALSASEVFGKLRKATTIKI
jgi:hypothetical protein